MCTRQSITRAGSWICGRKFGSYSREYVDLIWRIGYVKKNMEACILTFK